ncbi:cellulose synthase/poly-beta-1,6-N-acetylglucosamine synthase-like glycosyltransferase/peptidoglycan/xylan/chitin deacetylase (PgdA/CDA1 family)/spore germination protein YaaH [Novosphingobium chloroacetimidivorans]|uniref:Chitooligosaccharide deacetylase n=1 Tax=Novosphingobium chloroacetimidivorans TaxID=1428314 RepID=A0A7W7NXP8_9SPHN|nr:glycosyltransferase [Novosphingobium chloroacetimidivorans]MBB4860918.1 cellulose synthase/poly-beta-1,6-N-acetylglucosamine synthase-like glycosyltransferase/peptidoglycan/xylan/chitin deacetylase (PgdA/CDA1 family)/spore germination protein YaaH [Novosphingobium chloroacetimidivorans]
MTKPIFFDPTGRRSRWSRRGLSLVLLLVVLGAIAFATTLIAVPRQRELDLPVPHLHATSFAKSKLAHKLTAWLPKLQGKFGQAPLAVGFYMPNNDDSFLSLQRHGNELDWVVPALVNVSGPQHQVRIEQDSRFDRLVTSTSHRFKVLPMVQNYGDDQWDGVGAAALLHDPVQRRAFAQQLGRMVAQRGEKGVVMDFETLPHSAMADYVTFLRELRGQLPAASRIAVTVSAEADSWPLEAISAASDKVILMAYDQHWEGGEPGPIAPQDWFVREVQMALKRIGSAKIIVALGSYAYDWHGKQTDALSLEDAWLAAHDSDAGITFDPASGNAGFAYNEGDQTHTIWMLDAATSWNQLTALGRLGIQQVAMWRLGIEDDGFWQDLHAFNQGSRPDITVPRSVSGADVEGSGEILHITATPRDGARRVTFDASGVIRDEHYDALPTPYVVSRAGGSNPKLLALTFDDGPDREWTPRILDTLEAEHIPATFFVIGEYALGSPDLLKRIVADGDELGNHTYTHPNLAEAGPRDTQLQLNATQRLVEAYTGRSMTLFRAPYFGDAEPTTPDELGPALKAQQAGYTVVGLHVDPSDWKRPGTDAIVDQVIDQVHSSNADQSMNVILLHDGGGNRAETVAALPRIIQTLKSEGYQFVTASQLVGIPQSRAMPAISTGDLAAVRIDVAAFVMMMTLSMLLVWLFYLAISLGIARAVIMAGLAWFQSRRQRGESPTFEPQVSVIIPAYNEARVIAASVARVLASDYPALQVIVADDGSSDGTSEIVAKAFGDDRRVTLLTLENAGKAAALNRALQDAAGEVIIALDADTQFEAETIRRLVRWFDDPRIGAVAGDARVGNRVNLVTRWQAVEYITAQNLERRALAGFDAMTVIPGAVGAWRRAALDAVGGYPVDTLAEDQDLTIAIQRAGWRVTYDPRAVAWTEAPESFKALAKQRFRWAFGTLQCLWKHRSVIATGKPQGLSRIGLPQAWLFQIAFASISPLIDLALILSIVGTILRVQAHGWAQTRGDVGLMGAYWIAFVTVDVICGWIAYRLDGNRVRYPFHLLIAQRLVYRQIMYWVVLRAIASAVGGLVVGWGKLERTGRTTLEPKASALSVKSTSPAGTLNRVGPVDA